jgi:hypothetical protein
MVNLKRQLIKKIIGLTSFGALLVAVIFGLAVKGTNFRTNQDNQSSARENDQIEEQLAPINNERPEEVETSLFVEEYNEMETMECMSVGCGGFF